MTFQSNSPERLSFNYKNGMSIFECLKAASQNFKQGLPGVLKLYSVYYENCTRAGLEIVLR